MLAVCAAFAAAAAISSGIVGTSTIAAVAADAVCNHLALGSGD